MSLSAEVRAETHDVAGQSGPRQPDDGPFKFTIARRLSCVSSFVKFIGSRWSLPSQVYVVSKALYSFKEMKFRY